jgi:hypothetical protein
MDAQTLLKDVSQMPLLEMERFVQSVNALITQKKTTEKPIVSDSCWVKSIKLF